MKFTLTLVKNQPLYIYLFIIGCTLYFLFRNFLTRPNNLETLFSSLILLQCILVITIGKNINKIITGPSKSIAAVTPGKMLLVQSLHHSSLENQLTCQAQISSKIHTIHITMASKKDILNVFQSLILSSLTKVQDLAASVSNINSF